MSPPFAAYSGDAPYVFVCYSHADTEVVYADIAALHGAGLNIWYDEGISPGSEWSEELGHALAGAQHVLFYASEQSVASRHCRDEINFAHNHDTPILGIHLEEVKLPVGLELSLSSTQAIKRASLSTDAYLQKLKVALPDAAFNNEPAQPIVASPTKKRRSLVVPSGIVFALVLIAVAVLNRNVLIAQLVLNVPSLFFDPIEQQIGFATTTDDVRIAYAVTGNGPPLVIAIGWATHLEEGMNSPTYDGQGLLAMTSEQFTVIRYDGRGFGLSDRNIKDLSVEARVRDLEAVVDTLGLDRFYLNGVSAGGQPSILYAARHPDRVKGLVLGSTFASYAHRDAEALAAWELMLDLFASSWHRDSVVDVLIDRTFPGSDEVAIEIIRTFLRRSTNGQTIHDFFMGALESDVSEAAKQIQVPTLVMHGRDDPSVPLQGGRNIAAWIPGARFDIVEGQHQAGVGGTIPTRQRVLDFFLGLEAEDPTGSQTRP